jgi:hypothetical protein
MKILIAPSYNTYLEVSGKLLEDLAKCQAYRSNYGDDGYSYTKVKNELEIRTADDSRCFANDESYQSYNDLVKDNKALIKELEELKERMSNTSTDLTTED